MKTKSKKPKAVIIDMRCPCGKCWTDTFPTGKVRKVLICPGCKNFIKTDGSMSFSDKSKSCAACNRPLLNKHHCTYCGRPVKEDAVKVQDEPRVTFCPDYNIPSKLKRKL
jgi:hypothetical protein